MSRILLSLFGSEEVSISFENLDRYDDRDTICENLVESYTRLMTFVKKHLSDPFYLEGEQHISLRNVIFREVCSNLLIHREFSNAFPAKLIIEADTVRTENANRANGYGEIDMFNFSPLSKNPIISAFFREIGLADKLGSGVRNVNKYMKIYSGEKPQFVEGNIFKMLLPLGKSSSNKKNVYHGEEHSHQVTHQVTHQEVIEKLLAFCEIERGKKEICEYMGYNDLTYFTRKFLNPLIADDKLTYTVPDKPTSSKQKYVTKK